MRWGSGHPKNAATPLHVIAVARARALARPFPRDGAQSYRGRQNSAESGPGLAELGPTPIESGPSLPDLGQSCPEGQVWANFARRQVVELQVLLMLLLFWTWLYHGIVCTGEFPVALFARRL